MSARIEDLEPKTRGMCEALLLAAPAQGLPIRVTQTRRTMDEQLHIWMQGRQMQGGVWVVVDPRRIVTKARPGMSAHNYGLAFDVCFEGKDPYLHAFEVEHKDLDPRWYLLGALGESLGLSWGGPLGPNDDLKWDAPHFQRRNWRKYRVVG